MSGFVFSALLALLFLSCKGSRSLPPPSADVPIFIISIDTLRSDRLPIYGYKGIQTPNIDALRADGVLYEHAYAHTPLTLPSHTSLFTGLLPADHGVRDNIGYSLRAGVPTIAEVLKGRGYTTGAAVSSYVLRAETGVARGFDFYEDDVEAIADKARFISNIQRVGGTTAGVASEWIARQQKPVFFFLHLYDPHTPYEAPEPFRSQYSDRYDGEIAYSDHVVGAFLQSLKDAGLYDKSMIVLMSDHGEGLDDHGEEEHGMFLYREAIQVPLVVKLPQQAFAGKSVAAPAQLIDIVPTILERTGSQMSGKLSGRSLVALLDKPEKRAIYSETYYPRFHYGWADQHSLIDGEKHYIHSPKPELFDLAKDFGEKQNVLPDDRRGYFAMRASILPLIREAEAPSAIDPEEAAKLAALGYLGSTVQTKPGEVLPDPKDHLGTFREIGQAFVLFRDKKFEPAVQLMDKLLAANPRVLDLYDLKAKALGRLGRPEEAIETGKAGLRLAPNATNLAIDIAVLQLDARQFDEARKHAELAVKTDPAQAYDILARIALEQKDFARAEKEAKLALESDDRISALITFARVKREKGEIEEALKAVDEAMKRKKPHQEVVGLHFIRGDLLARLGRAEEAERDLRREIQLFPEDAQAYKNLVLLLVAGGRIPEATQLIRELIDASPTPPSYVAVCQVLDTLGDARGVRYWARQGLSKYPTHPTLRRLAG